MLTIIDIGWKIEYDCVDKNVHRFKKSFTGRCSRFLQTSQLVVQEVKSPLMLKKSLYSQLWNVEITLWSTPGIVLAEEIQDINLAWCIVSVTLSSYWMEHELSTMTTKCSLLWKMVTLLPCLVLHLLHTCMYNINFNKA